jgi:hypothetical protein
MVHHHAILGEAGMVGEGIANGVTNMARDEIDPVKNRLLLCCGHTRQALIEELKKLESGKMLTHDYDQHGVVTETTRDTAARIRGWIAQLDPVLEEAKRGL